MKNFILSILLLFVANVACAQNDAAIKKDLEKKYIEACRQINKQLPMYVDEITTFTSTSFVNWVWTSRYTVNIDSEEFTSEELNELLSEMKSVKIKSVPNMLRLGDYGLSQKDIYDLMRFLGLKLKFMYSDAYGEIIGSFTLDYKDLETNSKK